MSPLLQRFRRTVTHLAVVFGTVLILAPVHPSAGTDLENVRVELADGKSLKVTITEIKPDGSLLGPDLAAGLNLDQVTRIETNRPVKESSENRLQIHLLGGGWLYCDSIRIDLGQFIARVGEREVSDSVELLTAIVWSKTAQFEAQIQTPATDNDRVIVATDSGERVVSGILEKIDSTHVHVNFKGKSRKVSLAKVNSVVVADLQLEEPTGVKAKLMQMDGSVISGTLQSLSQNVVTMQLAANTTLRIPLEFVARVEVASSQIVFLSDLQPRDVQIKPLFGVARPWQRDLSVEKNPLQLREQSTGKSVTFAKGIGTTSFTSLTFDNPDGFNQFRAVVGIDVETNGKGDCEMIVQGDGIRLWAKRVRGTDDPKPIVVDTTGMKQITLIVHPGEEFDLGDHANWCDARFTKSKR